jgi:hypothetical protein
MTLCLVAASSWPGYLLNCAKPPAVERKQSGIRRRRSWTVAGFPSVPEIRNILARLLLKTVVRADFVMAWSRWRRDHPAEAAKTHYCRHNSEAQLWCWDALFPTDALFQQIQSGLIIVLMRKQITVVLKCV